VPQARVCGYFGNGFLAGVMRFFTVAMSLLLAAACCSRPDSRPAPLSVWAAVSLTDVLPPVASAWREQAGTAVNPVIFNFDASSRLAKQIAQGGPADIFISADQDWMTFLDRQGAIETDTRRPLLRNQLVLVVPADATVTPSLSELDRWRPRHLALGGENVPVGRYARAALKHLGAWPSLATQVVNADHTRAALTWVARREADAAVVYQTDAAAEPRVKVAFTFPQSSHPPIEYPVAVVRATERGAEARRLAAFLSGATARALFTSAGFGVVEP
jgi:molybdate transport system substrate-binding protein